MERVHSKARRMAGRVSSAMTGLARSFCGAIAAGPVWRVAILRCQRVVFGLHSWVLIGVSLDIGRSKDFGHASGRAAAWTGMQT